MTTPIKTYVKKLLKIVSQMQDDYPNKKFTLDGRLIGDIGEILAEQLYDLTLLEGLTKTHDAESHGRLVQIKTTMKNKLGFGDIPDYYIGLRVDMDGTVEEIFNGPGLMIWNLIKNRKRPKNYLYSINLSSLRKLNLTVKKESRINKKKPDHR